MDTRYGGPEYETIASFGSNCGIRSLEAIAAANQKCNANGLDTISAGMAISFAMECYQKGILTRSQADGLELDFGNDNAMLQLLDKIIKREGIGRLLSQGTARAAISLGRDADKCALTVKGQEVPMHEPRLKQGLSIGYATSPTGADHCHNYHDTYYVNKDSKSFNDLRAFGILEPVDAADLSLRKVRAFAYIVNWRHFTNCAVICYFVPFDFNQIVNIIGGVTGWNISLWELLKIGERALTMARAFNAREGLTGKDDSLPERFFRPFESGPLKNIAVDKNAFTEAVRAYYQMLGWDTETGIPTRAKLYELGIGWVADTEFSKMPPNLN
jgi:aldehyde:ferredoxin oxidoreductase